ncbi:flagellar basal body-associated FliL family protein [Sedimentitalea todarodis]|uniref:Flagellar protein FliL n=1 Tax=Sedimentitalea todarodis TaxID=1631240 RepID=A0ABU3VK61_9RHOB|nr:flagellar basal body-associated FliL family protein [Sedimentitalea todarodis]MDU9006574.1 flagellar basal body-associated FliL family protein [Sedimentitalea todarodis]
MADAVADAPDAPVKSKKLPLILGLVLAIAGAGGGFYVSSSGLLFGHGESIDADGHGAPDAHTEPLPDIAFVAIEPITISLTGNKHVRHLRFRSQLEVNGAHQEDVELILPRIVDVLNSYLRALDVTEFEEPQALSKLRGQMLRRVQVVAGQGRVRDLLVMEFVLN